MSAPCFGMTHKPPVRWGLIGWGGPALRWRSRWKRLVGRASVPAGLTRAIAQAVDWVKRGWRP